MDYFVDDYSNFLNICITFIIVYYNKLVFFLIFADWKMGGVDLLFEVGDN